MSEQQLNKTLIQQLPRMEDERGVLTFLEEGVHFPAPISQLHWTYIKNSERTRHYESDLNQFQTIIALAGRLTISQKNLKHTLSSIDKAISIQAPSRCELESSSICLALNTNPIEEELLDISTLAPSSSINDCNILQFSTTENRNGIVAIVGKDIPFVIRRIFYTYNVPNTARRGMHAHKDCDTILIAIRGSVEVEIDDGFSKETKLLNNSSQGLHIPAGIWSTQKNYSDDAICLVLASHRYDIKEYINDYKLFLEYKRNANRSIL